jgi:hypothetical protein
MTIRTHSGFAAAIQNSFALPTEIAWTWLEGGEIETTLEFLLLGFEIRDPSMPCRRMPSLDPVRPAPRFRAIVAAVIIPEK